MTGTVHVIGAGLAGLAAAVALAGAGRRVALHEAADHAGGRCRSYDDQALGCRIDNGNHLLLAANKRVMEFLDRIGARDTLVMAEAPDFPFVDLARDRRWVLRINPGRLPLWAFSAARRVPGTGAGDYLEALRLWRAGEAATVAETLDPARPLWRALWAPLCIAALNTQPDEASARLLWRILRETFGAGGAACRPMVPAQGLSESFVDPALARLAALGVPVGFGRRLRAIDLDGDRAAALRFAGADDVRLGPDDRVVLAVTAPVAAGLLPGLAAPDQFRAIVNAHYRFEAPPRPALGRAGFLGVIGGLTEWIFVKPGVVSVTISAADRAAERPAGELAAAIWTEVAQALELGPAPLPPWRIVKEKRATFAATPEQIRRRPGPATRWSNLWLAGDWTDTGLPATIEGALDSGFRAADRVLAAGPAAVARAA